MSMNQKSILSIVVDFQICVHCYAFYEDSVRVRVMRACDNGRVFVRNCMHACDYAKSVADPEGGCRGCNPPLIFIKRAVTSMTAVIDLVVTLC